MAPEVKKVGAAKKKQVDPRRELRRVRAEAAEGRGPKHKFDLWRSRKKARLTKAKSTQPSVPAAGASKGQAAVKALNHSQQPAQTLVESDEIKERRLGELKREAQKRRLFHDVRTLRQTLKKAKQLELRKAIRKWTGERAKHEGADTSEVDKYQRQVAAIKAADLTALVSRALDKVGLRQLASETGALAASDSTNDESVPSTRAQAKEDNDAAARLLGAKCVRVLLQQLVDTHSKTNSTHTHTTVTANKQPHRTMAKQQTHDNAVDDVDIETKAASARALSKLLAAKSKKTRLDQKPTTLSEDDSVLASASESDEEEGIDYPMCGSSDDEDGEDELTLERSDDDEEEGQEGSDVTQEEGEPGQVAKTLNTEANGSKSKGDSKAKPKVKPKVKKRLGQRARRRLAELQYGPAARHIQAQPSKAVQPPCRAVASAPPNPTKQETHNTKTNTAAVQRKPQAGVSAPTMPDKRNESEEELHPSWAAKRKLAEAMAAGGKGKKIKFNDE
eukprot:jgi/Chlat1/2743/Chrsp187S02934